MTPSRSIDGRWGLFFLSPIHQCLSLLHTSYLSMSDNYFRYLAVQKNLYLPFHTFLFILTMKTIPNFLFRYPYLSYRIMTLPITEVLHDTPFYPYLYQVSDAHLLGLQATSEDLSKYVQSREKSNIFAPLLRSLGKEIGTDKDNGLINIESVFSVEEMDSLRGVFDLLDVPNIPLHQQQIALMQFNFYMKILGVIPSTMDSSLLYIVLRQITPTGYKNKAKNQLDVKYLDLYDIPANIWAEQQELQLTVAQRGLLNKFQTFEKEQKIKSLEKKKLETQKRGFFDRIITSTTNKLFSQNDENLLEEKRYLTEPIYSGITFSIFSDFISSIGSTAASIQQQYRPMLSILKSTDGQTPDDDDEAKIKKITTFFHLSHNNYINVTPTNLQNIPIEKLPPANLDDVDLCSDVGALMQAKDGYKRSVEQQHRISVEKQGDFQRLYHYYNPNKRLQHTPELDENGEIDKGRYEGSFGKNVSDDAGSGSKSVNTGTKSGNTEDPSQLLASNTAAQSNSPLPTSKLMNKTVSFSDLSSDISKNSSNLPSKNPQDPILWKKQPFFLSPDFKPSPLTELSSSSITNAPALYPHYTPHHYYNTAVREKSDIGNNNVIVYATKGFDRTEFVVSGKCVLTLDSFIFIPLVSKTIIPYNSIVKIQLVPQNGMVSTIRANPYLCITYATQMKDSTMSYSSTGDPEADTVLHMVARNGYSYHEKTYIDSDDVYLLLYVLCDLISLSRMRTIVYSSDTDLRNADELSFGTVLVNAMARYHEAEKEVQKKVKFAENELILDQSRLFTQQQRDKITALDNGNQKSPFLPQVGKTVKDSIKNDGKHTKLIDTKNAQDDEQIEPEIQKFLSRRSSIRQGLLMMKLPPFKSIVHELMVLYKHLHKKSTLNVDNSNSYSDDHIPTSPTSPTSPTTSLSITNQVGKVSASQIKAERLSLLAQHVQTSDPNYRVLGLLRPLIHYDYERHHQTLLDISIRNCLKSKTKNVSENANKTCKEQLQIADQADTFSSSPSPIEQNDSLNSQSLSSLGERRDSFSIGLPSTLSSVNNSDYTFSSLLQFPKELRFYDIDYSLPCPDGIHPAICNTKSTSTLNTIPNFKKTKFELFSLFSRDILNNISTMISMYYFLQQQHISTNIPQTVLLPSLSCLKPVFLTPQKEVIKAIKLKKGTFQTSSTQFDLRDVFHKGREPQQKLLFLSSIQWLFIHTPEKLPLHIMEFIKKNQNIFYTISQQTFSLSALKNPNPTGIGFGGSDNLSIQSKNTGTHSSSSSSSSSSSGGMNSDKKTEEFLQKQEKNMPHTQFSMLLQQQHHFKTNHYLHSNEYLDSQHKSLGPQPWVLNVISHALLEERAAQYMVQVWHAKQAFENTIKKVPESVNKSTKMDQSTSPPSTQATTSPSQSPTQHYTNNSLVGNAVTGENFALNATMTGDDICDLTLFEYSNLYNKYVEEQYYGYHNFSADLTVQQHALGAALKRREIEIAERLEAEKLMTSEMGMIFTPETTSRRAALRRKFHRRKNTGQIIIQDTEVPSSDSDSGGEDGEELNELVQRKGVEGRFGSNNQNQQPNSQNFPHNLQNSHNYQYSPTNSQNLQDKNRLLFNMRNSPHGSSSGQLFDESNTGNSAQNEKNTEQAPEKSPQRTSTSFGQDVSRFQSPSAVVVAQSPPRSTLTRGDSTLGPKLAPSVQPIAQQIAKPQALPMPMLPPTQYNPNDLSKQDVAILHSFWYHQQQIHNQRNFNHIKHQKQVIIESNISNITHLDGSYTGPQRIDVVSGLSLFLVTFLSHPTYLHSVPGTTAIEFNQAISFQQRHISPCAIHQPREQLPLVGEDFTLIPRTIGDGVVSVLEKLQEQNLNRFSIKGGIETVMLTKTSIEPIFILFKLISTIVKWKHPEFTGVFVTFLLLCAMFNLLYLLLPSLILLVIIFFLLQKNQPFWLELELAPWCEGDLKMTKEYMQLMNVMVPSELFPAIMVSKASLLTEAEKHQYIATNSLKKYQRARYVYYAVRGKDYWGKPLLKYDHDVDPDVDNLGVGVENGQDDGKDSVRNGKEFDGEHGETSGIIDVSNLNNINHSQNVPNNNPPNNQNNLPQTNLFDKNLTISVNSTHFDPPSNSTTSTTLSERLPSSTNDNTPPTIKTPHISTTQSTQSTQPQSSPQLPPTNSSSRHFLAQFRPNYHIISTSHIVTTTTSILNAITKITSIQSQITQVYDKATLIQNTLTKISSKLLKIQGLFRWTTPQASQKLVLVLCGAIFALLLLPFRLVFGVIVIDMFSKKWQKKLSFSKRLLNEVEIAAGNHYTLVTDDDINKVFPKHKQLTNSTPTTGSGMMAGNELNNDVVFEERD